MIKSHALKSGGYFGNQRNKEICLMRNGNTLTAGPCDANNRNQWFNSNADGGVQSNNDKSKCLQGASFQNCGSKRTDVGRDGGMMPGWETSYFAKGNQKWVW